MYQGRDNALGSLGQGILAAFIVAALGVGLGLLLGAVWIYGG